MYPALNRLTAMRNPLFAPNASSAGSFAPGRVAALAFDISQSRDDARMMKPQIELAGGNCHVKVVRDTNSRVKSKRKER